jgi:hypothetical protein
MIEKNYSRYIIGDPSEALTRAMLLDFGTVPSSAEVIPMKRQEVISREVNTDKLQGSSAARAATPRSPDCERQQRNGLMPM